jgi:hypothetical protein
MRKGVKAMRHSIIRCFLSPSSGDDAAHADSLHLPSWVCNFNVSRHAHRVAWSPSPHPLLAGFHASCAPGATHFGRDGPLDPSDDDGVALWAPPQSGLLERASACPLVGARYRGYLAATPQWRPVSAWRMAVTPTNAASRILRRREAGPASIIPGFLACVSCW